MLWAVSIAQAYYRSLSESNHQTRIPKQLTGLMTSLAEFLMPPMPEKCFTTWNVHKEVVARRHRQMFCCSQKHSQHHRSPMDT
jgi:hypothetical protein